LEILIWQQKNWLEVEPPATYPFFQNDQSTAIGVLGLGFQNQT